MAAAAFSVILRLCVVLLFLGAGHRESYWNGCIKAAIVIRQQIVSDLALVIFLLTFLFLALALRSGFVAAISDVLARSSSVFCNSVSDLSGYVRFSKLTIFHCVYDRSFTD